MSADEQRKRFSRWAARAFPELAPAEANNYPIHNDGMRRLVEELAKAVPVDQPPLRISDYESFFREAERPAPWAQTLKRHGECAAAISKRFAELNPPDVVLETSRVLRLTDDSGIKTTALVVRVKHPAIDGWAIVVDLEQQS